MWARTVAVASFLFVWPLGGCAWGAEGLVGRSGAARQCVLVRSGGADSGAERRGPGRLAGRGLLRHDGCRGHGDAFPRARRDRARRWPQRLFRGPARRPRGRHVDRLGRDRVRRDRSGGRNTARRVAIRRDDPLRPRMGPRHFSADRQGWDQAHPRRAILGQGGAGARPVRLSAGLHDLHGGGAFPRHPAADHHVVRKCQLRRRV